MVDAGVVETLAHVDPKGGLAQSGCGRIHAGSLAGPEQGAAPSQVPLLVAPVADGRQLLKDAEDDDGAEQRVVVGHLARVELDDQHLDASLVCQVRRLRVPGMSCRKGHDGLEQDGRRRREAGDLERELSRRVGAV